MKKSTFKLLIIVSIVFLTYSVCYANENNYDNNLETIQPYSDTPGKDGSKG